MKLKYEDLGSNCCGAPIIDHGNTGEGRCSDCKEHCGRNYYQEISLIVLTLSGAAHRHLLTYHSCDDDDDDLDNRVQSRVDRKYNINECRFSYSTDNVLSFIDHTNGGTN